jgi:hypothetical protein
MCSQQHDAAGANSFAAETGETRMWSKKTSGLIGMIVGALWFVANVRHFSEQGFVAIGMPIIIFVLGVVYFFKDDGEVQ